MGYAEHKLKAHVSMNFYRFRPKPGDPEKYEVYPASKITKNTEKKKMNTEELEQRRENKRKQAPTNQNY